MMDLNEAGPQMERGGVIPAGTFAKLQMNIRPGGASAPGLDPMDAGLLKASKTSDVLFLDCEFTVVGGPHNKRKLWSNLSISGGKTDDKGQSMAWGITKATLRAIIESATATMPNDASEAAKAKRVFQGFKQLDGIQFYARIGVEPGGDDGRGGKYPDKNRIDHVVTPADPEYAALAAGKEVAPAAVAATAPRAAAPSAPAWAAPGNAAAKQAAPAAAKPAWLT